MRPLWLSSPVLLIAAATAVSGCGGSDSGGLDAVAKAAEATRSAGTAQLTLSGTIETAGQRLPMTGEGTVSTRNDGEGRLTMTISHGGEHRSIDEIISKGAIYMGGDLLAKKIPFGKKWMRIDILKVLKEHGADPSQFDQGGGSATKALDYLNGADDVKKVGTEQIRGVQTTHYHAVIDYNKAADEIKDEQFRSMMKKSLGDNATQPADVWVDAKNRIRRSRMVMPVAQGKMEMTMDYLRFGVLLNTDPPPSDDVFDATKLVEKQIEAQGNG